MKSFEEFAEGHVAIDHTGKPITMQDVRLMAGEGKLSKKTIKQAVGVIQKRRKEDADRIANYKG